MNAKTEHQTIRLYGGPGLRPEPLDPINGRAIHLVIACTEAEAHEWCQVSHIGSGVQGLLHYFMREGACFVDIQFEIV